MTMAKWCHKWLALRAGAIAPRTVDNYKHLVTAYIVPAIGDRPLAKLRPKHIRAALGVPVSAGYTRTAEQIYVLLGQILKDAVRAGHIAHTPMDGVDRPRHDTARTRWWTPEDAAQFLRLRQLALDPHIIVWMLALCLGLRRGELCGLRWSDIDLAERTITIVRQRVTLADGRTVVTKPKSASSARVLPIPDDLAVMIADYARRVRADRTPCAYVALASRTGQPITPSGLDQAWRRAVRDCAGTVLPITLHGCRHTCGVSAVRAGVSMRVLQDILGHSSMTITSAIYAHADRKIIAAAVDSIARLVL